MIEIFIQGNVPSLKNSKVKTSRGIFPSKTVTKYLRSLGIQAYSASKKTVTEYKTKENEFKIKTQELRDYLKSKTYPVEIYFHFVRDSKRAFDFNNANQIILDLLTAHEIIPDDNMDYIIPIPYKKDGKYYTLKKEQPGVWVKIK